MEQARIDAARAGLTQYKGKACRVCGDDSRFVGSSNCVTCNRNRVAAKRAKDRELLKQLRGG